MTDLATLNLRIDSTDVSRGVGELDKLTAAGTKTERATDQMGRGFVKASSAAGQLRMQEAALEAEVQRVIRAHERAVVASKAQEIANQRLGVSAGGLTQGLGAQRAGMQQLSYQLGDMSTMFALGARPMQIFASQAGQTLQAVQLMSGGTSAFATFLGGPWGIAITSAVVVLGSLLSATEEEEEAITELDQAFDFAAVSANQLAQINGLLADSNREVAETAIQAARAMGVRAQANATNAGAELRRAEAELERQMQVTRNGGGIWTAGAAGAMADRTAQLERSVAGFREEVRRANADVAIMTARLSEQEAAAEALTARQNDLRNEYVRTGNTGALEQAIALQTQIDELGKATDRATGASGANATALRAQARAAAEAERALKDVARQEQAATEKAQEYADRQNDKAKAQIEEAYRAEQEAGRATATMNDRIRQIENEITLLPLVGQARELAALALEEETFKAQAAAQGLVDLEDAWNRYLDARTREINERSALERDAEAARIMADELGKLIGMLGRVGGIGGAIGGLIGLLNGQETTGTIGSLLGTAIGTQTDDQGKTIARTIGDEMRDIFKLDGEFGQTMSGLLEGAGAGVMIGNAIFGDQSTLGQLGSAIGAAAGQAAGAAIGGPIGAMIGKVVGSALGGAVGGALAPKGGSATLGNVNGSLDVTGYAGGSSSRREAAGELAGGVAEIIAQIASELGGTVNSASGAVSIGLRGNNYRVDTTGGGAVKTGQGAIDFGKDAEAAVLFAVKDLINDGVIEGLRQGTANLIRNSKDLEKALSDALAFEKLMDAVDNIGLTDYQIALKDLEKEYTNLVALLGRASASTAEYAALEAYIADQRESILADQAQAAVDDLSQANSVYVQLLTMLGRGEEALALARLGELAAMDSTLQGLQAMVYELEDARAVIDQFGPLADSLRDFRDVLLGQTATGSSLATAQAAFRDTASLAANGDATALADLETSASAYLEAAKASASTALDYQRAVGEVLAGVDSGIFAADSQVEYAQLQIDAINRNADIVAGMANMLETYQVAIVENTTSLRRIWERFEGDGLRVKTDADTPIQVEVV